MNKEKLIEDLTRVSTLMLVGQSSNSGKLYKDEYSFKYYQRLKTIIRKIKEGYYD